MIEIFVIYKIDVYYDMRKISKTIFFCGYNIIILNLFYENVS